MVIDFSEQILRALEIIHSHQLIHRDLKPSNILVTTHREFVFNWAGDRSTETLKILLADFGLSRTLSCPPRTMTKQIQSLFYRAPEVMLDNMHYSQAVDMWSTGTMILEMLTG